MNKKLQRNLLITLSILGIFYFLYLVRSILLPFTLGIIIAYLLGGITNKLEKYLKNRKAASIIIVSTFSLIIIMLFAFVLPIILDQSIKLAKELSLFFNEKNDFLYSQIDKIFSYLKIQDGMDAKKYIGSYGEKVASYSLNIVNNILSTSIAFITVLSLLIITPITTYYFLNDWNNIISTIRSFLSEKVAKKMDLLFKEIDKTLSGCLKGQLTVCLILGIIYGFLLMAINLKYGFVIGFLTGLANFIPYFGMFIGCTIALIMTIYQFGFGIEHILLVGGIFMFGQILEANFITPKLVGNKINLHPMWIIFALFCGGALFGFVGLILALPVVGILGVLIRFYIKANFKRRV